MAETTSSTPGNAPSKATNPRGIPEAPFIDRVEDVISSRDQVEDTLRNFQEMISKYQFMELNTQRRATGLKEKAPEMQKSLETVQFLRTTSKASKPIETAFALNDTLYAKGLVPPTEEVYLWLGANVMLAYPLDEAESMLQSKLEAATNTLAACEEDLDYLRGQITTLEVAMARVYNWDVAQKRKGAEHDKTASVSGAGKGRLTATSSGGDGDAQTGGASKGER